MKGDNFSNQKKLAQLLHLLKLLFLLSAPIYGNEKTLPF